MSHIIKKTAVFAVIALVATNIAADFVPAGSELNARNAETVCQQACKATGKKYLGEFISPETNENLWVQLSDKHGGFGDFCACMK